MAALNERKANDLHGTLHAPNWNRNDLAHAQLTRGLDPLAVDRYAAAAARGPVETDDPFDFSDLLEHVILVGHGRVGSTVGEALTRAGKDLSRETLISKLETLYEYDTGLTPRITFGPNRRIGATGAHIVALDAK